MQGTVRRVLGGVGIVVVGVAWAVVETVGEWVERRWFRP